MADKLIPGPFGTTIRLVDQGDGSHMPASGLSPSTANTPWSYAAASGGIVNTTGVTIKTAAGAALRNYLRTLQISNGGAAGTDVQIRDGASGTVVWRGYVPAMANGECHKFDPPLKGTANTLMEVGLSSATTVAVYVNAQGFIAA